MEATESEEAHDGGHRERRRTRDQQENMEEDMDRMRAPQMEWNRQRSRQSNTEKLKHRLLAATVGEGKTSPLRTMPQERSQTIKKLVASGDLWTF
ncbi:hypothetical protein PFLUV_G00107060 [Perca fluviatilis]|uniref:Uncharacterized protein n=1 Tax=Perca fluviatilis TaxID=8168 RepID=A0A6A5E8X0_PERFL|nr:hypothetical protein PFLUV_G00107060 [Perca fluviatilis]